MALIALGGFRQDSNTLATSRADGPALGQPGGCPEAPFGAAIAAAVTGAQA